MVSKGVAGALKNGSRNKVLQFYDTILVLEYESSVTTERGEARWIYSGVGPSIGAPKLIRRMASGALPQNFF